MQLVYESAGERGAPWTVELVRLDLEHAGRSGCSEIVFAPRGGAEGPEVRWRCREGDLLWAHGGDAEEWSVLRPVGPNATWSRTDESGQVRARYVTGETSVEHIGDWRVPVVETTVETFDAEGTLVRRLRERYATGLDTATWGMFEVPDAAEPSGWRTTLSFELVAIVP
jgi:hypothetical protein